MLFWTVEICSLVEDKYKWQILYRSALDLLHTLTPLAALEALLSSLLLLAMKLTGRKPQNYPREVRRGMVVIMFMFMVKTLEDSFMRAMKVK